MKDKKVLDIEGLRRLRAENPDRKICQCHGVFDVLHAGHLAYFQAAKKFGDLLVITITSDEYVNKGPGRPYFNSAIRANMIAALEIVDYVAISRSPTAVMTLEALRPDFYVKGPDYKDKSADTTGGIYLEDAAVTKGGGQLVFTDDETYSSSTLINRFFQQWSDDQMVAIEGIRKLGGFSAVENCLNQIAEQDVCIIGEPIIDTYVFCSPDSISSKSPSISASFLYQEDYLGGSVAIANHLADFTKSVTLLITHGGDPHFRKLLDQKLDPRVRLVDQVLSNIPTPRKTRFLTFERSQRLFELTHLRSDQWLHHSPDTFASLMKKNNSKKITTLLADFGHGLFEGKVLATSDELDGFVCANVQTNSSNFGFNPFTKHKKFSYLSLDRKEAQIAYHDRFTPELDLARRLQESVKTGGSSVSMTLGASGSYYFSKNADRELYMPAFADAVIDTTGAGDAYYGLSALFARCQSPDLIVPFAGNVFAGLKTKIIGNKTAISKAQFVKAVTAILK